MSPSSANDKTVRSVQAAHVILPCEDLQETLDFFVTRLGFRLNRISPADAPRTAEISGHGLNIELRRGCELPPGRIRISSDTRPEFPSDANELIAPNGTLIEFSPASPRLIIPELQEELVIGRLNEANWGVGRAGMRYRDLIPSRLGGRFIASHIQIPEGGSVPDSVHFHQIRFQLIYCVKGWVSVLYEDQGPALLLEAGDCFLQPPLIRHRVLECSAGLEVIEIACPAEHDTFLDHELKLPTDTYSPERIFGGQRFVHHRMAEGSWNAWTSPGFESRDLGLHAATDGVLRAQVVRAANEPALGQSLRHDGEFRLLYILEGSLVLEPAKGNPLCLEVGDNIVLPAALETELSQCSDDLQLLEVLV